jgi:hypothetical protein
LQVVVPVFVAFVLFRLSRPADSFVASISRALSLDQVPCVLWGHYLLDVHGVPSIIGVGIP